MQAENTFQMNCRKLEDIGKETWQVRGISRYNRISEQHAIRSTLIQEEYADGTLDKKPSV